MNKINGVTRFSVSTNKFFPQLKAGKVIYLVELSVDLGDHGYNCWGYKIAEEAAEAGPLHFDHSWRSPGQVLDEVLKADNASH